jgi:hypothetical protein
MRRKNAVVIDPTYVRAEIEANPVWELAYTLSEIMNDDAPMGWCKYIFPAECLLAAYDIKPRGSSVTSTPPIKDR